MVSVCVMEQNPVFQDLKCEWFTLFQQGRELIRCLYDRLDNTPAQWINLSPFHGALKQYQHIRVTLLLVGSAGHRTEEYD